MTRFTGLICSLLAALAFSFGAQSACGTGGLLIKQPVSKIQNSIVRELQLPPSRPDGSSVPKKILFPR
jgi:hypothetical protein